MIHYYLLKYALFLIVVPMIMCDCTGSSVSTLPRYSRSELREGVQVLKNYNFQEKGYTLAGFHYGMPNEISDRIGEFYVSDGEMLEKIKNEWTFYEASKYYKCGYHYDIKLLKDGALIEDFSVNIGSGCNAIVTDNGPLVFETDKLEKFEDDLRPMLKVKENFVSINDGRAFISKVTQSDAFIYGPKPIWHKFQGNFIIEIQSSCEMAFTFELPGQEKSTESVRKELIKKYGQDTFQIVRRKRNMQMTYNNRSQCTDVYEIICDKEWFEGFNKYKAVEPWKEFADLEWVFWQKDNRTQQKAAPVAATPPR